MLEEQRERIDAIDKALVHLFEERAQVVLEVAQIKQRHGLDVLDKEREQGVIEKVQSYLEDQSLQEDIKELYKEIMRLSRERQNQWLDNQE